MPRPARPNRPVPDPPPEEAAPSPEWAGLVGLLLAARYLQPTEGAVFGETIWQAQLWLAAAAVWCWMAVRSGRASIRWSPLDGFAWLLVAGHWLSTIPVFVEGGDRRAAVNVGWEWAGLAATVFLVRQVLVGRDSRKPLGAFGAVMVAIAALGVWQHHVSQPATAARYGTLLAEEAELSSGDGTADARRLPEVRAELRGLGRPEDVASRRRWEDRVRFSTEPFGTFALANTLGGLLAAALPLVVVTLAARPKPVTAVGIAAAAGVMLYCLILTKSRTAWVGLAAGGVAAAGLIFVRSRLSRRALMVAAGGCAAVLLVGLVVLATGGLDAAVFSEAPRSMRFRLDYWIGAARVLGERPLLGTGAGNFRSYYLEHRPEGASEAIAAPHNLFLDVWAAGGLLSLIALVGLLAYAAFRFASAGREDIGEETLCNGWSAFEWGVVAAFPVVTFVLLVAGQGLDWRFTAIGLVAAPALLLLNRPNGGRGFVVASGAGCCALVVHLLGADGIEFPAVVQTILLLAIAADRAREFVPAAATRYGFVSAAGMLAAGCLMFGTRPVLNSAALTARANALAERGDPAADAALAEAAEADPLAMEPLILRAELATADAMRSGSGSDAARRRWRAALEAQPRDVQARRRLAGLLLSRVRNSDDLTDAASAADLLREAVEFSPTDAGLRADLARAAARSGRKDLAAEAAAEALRLDEVNRAAGHFDLFFTDESRAELSRLAVVGNGWRPP